MMKKRVLGLGIFLFVVGIGFAVAAYIQRPKFTVTEAWMETKAPNTVDEMPFFRSSTNPEQSYKMDQQTYDLLQPFGIVSRVYSNVSKQFDVVLISSNRRESFHSPTVCLPSQGWKMGPVKDITINTKSHGVVPITIAEVDPPDNTGKQWIAYFYRTQNRFIANSNASILVVTLAMFEGPLKGDFDMNAVFYRITTRYSGASEDDLKAFVADYLDAANASSGGYF